MGRISKKHGKLLDVMDMVIILIVVMASWVYSSVKMYQIVYFKCGQLHINYTSIRLIKDYCCRKEHLENKNDFGIRK